MIIWRQSLKGLETYSEVNSSHQFRCGFYFGQWVVRREPLVRQQADFGSATHQNRCGCRATGTQCQSREHADTQLEKF